VWTHQGKADP